MQVKEIFYLLGRIFNNIMAILRHLRKLLVTDLTSAKRIEATKHIRAEETANMFTSIIKQDGAPVTVKAYINIMSMSILSRTILYKRFLGLSEQSSSEVHEFIEIVEEEAIGLRAIYLQDIFTCVPDWLDLQGLTARFAKLRARMDVFYERMMAQHREE